MLVSCPQCTSRYNLSDDKVRSSGTKVRCPRCQHTFKVFLEKAPAKEPTVSKKTAPQDDVLSERTEMFKRSDVFSSSRREREEETASTRTVKSKRPRKAEIPEDFGFDAKTELMAPKASTKKKTARPPEQSTTTKKEKEKEASPFKRPSRKVDIEPSASDLGSDLSTPDLPDLSLDVPQRKIETPEEEPIAEKPRPFGDATFAMIQKMSKPKNHWRRASFIVFLLVSGSAVFWIFSGGSDHDEPREIVLDTRPIEKPKQEVVEINRPSGWYQDDGRIYQEYLAQMASLPKKEKVKPQNRGLIADALVLNGVLNSAYDQVATGLSYASSLMTAHPHDVFGFYAVTNYAFLKEDVQTLNDIVDRWPENHQSDPEYLLARVITTHRENNSLEETLSSLKKILTQVPDYQRAQEVAFGYSLENENLATEILGERWMKELKKSYQKHREIYSGTGSILPPLYANIDAKLQRLNKAPKKTEEAPAEVAKTTPPPPVEKPKPAKKPTKLPKPSQGLIAINEQAKLDSAEATRLYEEANKLMRQNKVDDAQKTYQRALRLNPDFADIYKKLGMIHMNKNEKNRALRNFRIYLQLAPQSNDKQLVERWIASLQ